MKLFQGRKAPKGGAALLNFEVADYEPMILRDRHFLERRFRSVSSATYPEVPQCDVLFLYPALSDDGSIVGTSESLRDIIRRSRARIAVIASAHSAEQLKPVWKSRPEARVNLVATLDRKGERFPEFFEKLFTLMKGGMDMPRAWVQLSPQTHRASDHADLPDTVFACELGATRL